MNVFEASRRDWARFSQQVDIAFSTPDGATTATVKGLPFSIHAKIEMEVDQHVNSRHAAVTVSEQLLTAQNYPVRDPADENRVDMSGHLITWTDSADITRTWQVNEIHADETSGILRIIVGDYG